MTESIHRPSRSPYLNAILPLIALGSACVMAGPQGLAYVSDPDSSPVAAAVFPPLVTVLLAFITRNIFLAFGTGFFCGGILAFGFNPLRFLPGSISDFVVKNLTDQFQIYIFLFLFFLVSLIHLAYRSGGINGLIDKLKKLVKGPTSAKLMTFVAGFFIFFDDYCNTVVVGSTFRSLSDRWKVSREKLAYIVDSTTAPIAGIAFVSTWIGFEVWLLGSTASRLGMETNGYQIFLDMWGFRFYCLGTLIFVLLTILSKKDFGPMLKAERRAGSGKSLFGTEGTWTKGEMQMGLEPDRGTTFLARYSLVPLTAVIAVVIIGIVVVGYFRMERDGMISEAEPFLWFSMESWSLLIAAAAYDTQNPDGPGIMIILSAGAVVGFILALLMPLVGKALNLKSAAFAVWKTVPTLKTALFILLMAWAMKTISETIGTDQYLITVLGDAMPLWAIPAGAFLVACIVSFATGTSWGSMGLLIPVLLPLAHAMGGDDPAAGLIFLLTAAAILDGSIFGDHCSPISDTTILSCLATRCEPIDHVVTQGGYALVVAAFALLVGYLATAMGAPGWLYFVLLPLGSLLILNVIGRSALSDGR